MRRTLRVGDRGSDKPACVPSTSVSPLKRREKDGLVTSGRARRHDVTKGRGGFWGVEGAAWGALFMEKTYGLLSNSNCMRSTYASSEGAMRALIDVTLGP